MRDVTRIEQATQRLVSAVERLERAVEGQSLHDDGDRERLSRALAAAQADYAALQNVTHKVTQRLDAAIGRLRLMLEG